MRARRHRLFRQPELRRTFCPTRDEYFERDQATGLERPRANVFTGFDQVLDYGKVVGLEMPKQIFFDAAIFTQVALKAQWQDSVLRREGIGPDGRPLAPPRFGETVGYCPTFLMADEAQISATPRDAEFKAVCRSKRASMWELTQSHSSIKGAFGQAKAADADTYFQNSMTHIYLRQADPGSMKIIQEEVGKKIIQKTTLAVTEGGTSSELSYVQGEIVHEGLGISSTKTVCDGGEAVPRNRGAEAAAEQRRRGDAVQRRPHAAGHDYLSPAALGLQEAQGHRHRDPLARLAGGAARHLRLGDRPADHNVETLGCGGRRRHRGRVRAPGKVRPNRPLHPPTAGAGARASCCTCADRRSP